MRVMYVLSDLRADGAQRSTVALAGRLQGLGHETLIVPLTDRPPSLVDEAKGLGIEVPRLSASRFRHQVPELRRLIRSRRPDIVHTALWNADIAGRVAAARTPSRVMSTFVNSPNDIWSYWPATRRPWRAELKRDLDAVTSHLLVDHFLAVSTGAATTNEAALRLHDRRVTVVERGRDPSVLGTRTDERRARVRDALGLSVERPVIMAIGRGDAAKGHDIVLRAVATVRRSVPDAVLLIAGRDGGASRDLRARQRELELDDDAVRFLGHRSDVADLIAAADVFVIASFFEGGIASGSEALAIGTPLVMTRIPAVSDLLVDGHNALLVTPGDAHELAEAILAVFRDPIAARDRAVEGRALFDERFDIDVCARRMVTLYEDVLARGRQRLL